MVLPSLVKVQPLEEGPRWNVEDMEIPSFSKKLGEEKRKEYSSVSFSSSELLLGPLAGRTQRETCQHRSLGTQSREVTPLEHMAGQRNAEDG